MEIGNCAEQFRTMMSYSYCPKYKAGVEMSVHGRATHQCPNCGKYVEIDYDRETARVINVCHGASKKYRC